MTTVPQTIVLYTDDLSQDTLRAILEDLEPNKNLAMYRYTYSVVQEALKRFPGE